MTTKMSMIMPDPPRLPDWVHNTTQLLIIVTLTGSFHQTEMLLGHLPRILFNVTQYEERTTNKHRPIRINTDDSLFLFVFCKSLPLFRLLRHIRDQSYSWNNKNPLLLMSDCIPMNKPNRILQELWIEFGLLNTFIYLDDNWMTIADPMTKPEEFIVSQKPPKELKNFNRNPLRVALFSRNGSVYRTSDGKWNGVEIWILKKCLKCMNATAKFIPTAITSDKYSEGLELISNAKADIFFNAIFVKAYKRGLEFSMPFGQDSICVVVPKTPPLTQAWALDRSLPSFAKVSVILTCLVIILFEYFENIIRKSKNKPDISLIIIENIRIFLSFPTPRLPKRFVARIRFICLLYLGYLFSMSLQIKLLPALTRPQYGPQIDTVDDLIKSGITVRIGSSNLYDTFLGNDSWGKLKNKIKIQLNDSMSLKGWVTRMNDLEIFTLSPTDHLVSQCPSTYRLAYVYKIGQVWNTIFNKCLNRLIVSGLIDFRKKTNIHVLKQRALLELPLKPRPLVLEDLQMAFILYFFGIGLSFLFYFISYLKYYKESKKKIKILFNL